MKVLMTSDTLGGVWMYAVQLCEALAPFGVEIALATMGRRLTPDQRDMVRALTHVELFESNYKLCWMENSWKDVARAGDWLRSITDRDKPDLIHLNDYPHGGLKWPVPSSIIAVA